MGLPDTSLSPDPLLPTDLLVDSPPLNRSSVREEALLPLEFTLLPIPLATRQRMMMKMDKIIGTIINGARYLGLAMSG